MQIDPRGGLYLLLDSRDEPLAHGQLLNAPDQDELHVRVLDNSVDDVVNHEMIQLVGVSDDAASRLGRVMRRSGDVVGSWDLDEHGQRVLSGIGGENAADIVHFVIFLRLGN